MPSTRLGSICHHKKKKSNKQQKRTSRINNAIGLLKDREPQRIVTIRTRGLMGRSIYPTEIMKNLVLRALVNAVVGG